MQQPKLRTLSEAEVYARLYGRQTESYVVVVNAEPRERPRALVGLSGEEIRRLFEDRLEAREPLDWHDEEAA
jgi:hypothetical protein